MKSIKLIFLVLLILMANRISFAQDEPIAAVESFISAQGKMKAVTEYKFARKTLRADMNADDKADLIVLYTLDGFKTGKGSEQYLAVFIQKETAGFQFADQKKVSGIVEKQIELKSAENGEIRLETLEYFKKAGAHYRKTGELKFVYADGKLVRD